MNNEASSNRQGGGVPQSLPSLRVRITAPLVPRDAAFQLPGNSHRWGRCEFVWNPPDDDPCDYWIVLGYAYRAESATVAPCNTLFINGEPPAKKRYPRAFYRQFYRVVDNHAWSQHPRLVLDTACMGWHAGNKLSAAQGEASYDYFSRLPRPRKQNKIGVVCSASTVTAGQRQRLKFLEQLKRHFGDRVVHFGRGFLPIEDKLEAILPYRFQLVLENSVSPHYWTEKLADAYVGWGFPLYVGCPNLGDYFESRSYQMLDITDLARSIRVIETCLEQPEAAEEISAVAEARRRVLNEYNLGVRCARMVEANFVNAPKEKILLRDYKHFHWWDRLRRQLGLSKSGMPKPASGETHS